MKQRADWVARGIGAAGLIGAAGAGAVGWLARGMADEALERSLGQDKALQAMRESLSKVDVKLDMLVHSVAAIGNKVGAVAPAAASNVWDAASAGLEVLGDYLDDDNGDPR